MTNLDVMCRILSEASGRPEAVFRRTLAAAIEAGIIPGDRLLAPAQPGMLEQLRGELPGVLAWLVEGAQMAHRHDRSSDRRKFQELNK